MNQIDGRALDAGFFAVVLRTIWEIAMPKVRTVEKMDQTELRAELVAVLTEGVIRYMSKRYAEDQAVRQKALDSETACLELPLKSVLSVNSRVNDR